MTLFEENHILFELIPLIVLSVRPFASTNLVVSNSWMVRWRIEKSVAFLYCRPKDKNYRKYDLLEDE